MDGDEQTQLHKAPCLFIIPTMLETNKISSNRWPQVAHYYISYI